MATEANALGDFLRARRQQVRPEDVGLVPGARRRVAGLRREELAMLAGISAEYYLRLEVGRDKHPSPQVIDALARALRLDTKARQHLHALVTAPGADTPELEASAYALAEVIDEFLMPAILTNRYQDVLAANPLARALSPGFSTRTKLPALAPAGSRRPRALRKLGRGDRDGSEWITGTQRSLPRRCSHAGVCC